MTVSDNQKSSVTFDSIFMKFVARININSIDMSPSFEFKLLQNARVYNKSLHTSGTTLVPWPETNIFIEVDSASIVMRFLTLRSAPLHQRHETAFQKKM